VETGCTPLTYRTGQRGIMLIMQDVTDRIRAEQERRRAEDELRLHATVLRGFHEISSDRSLTLEEKLNRLLKLGCEQFGLPIGILSQVNGDIFRVLDSVGGEDLFPVGSARELKPTSCGGTVLSNEPVALEHAGTSEWRDHPNYTQSGLEAYIGVRVQVENEVYGTLCFASLSRAPNPSVPPTRDPQAHVPMVWAASCAGNGPMPTCASCRGPWSRPPTRSSSPTAGVHRVCEPRFRNPHGSRKEEVIGQKTLFPAFGPARRQVLRRVVAGHRHGRRNRGTLVTARRREPVP